MRTALDTNVLSALWSNEASAGSIALLLTRAKGQGALLVSPFVYAELLAYPRATEKFVGSFLSDTGITVDFALDESLWTDVGRRFARYVGQRRKTGDGTPKRLLTDFFIGSHALVQADRLMTLDASRYKTYFPELKLV